MARRLVSGIATAGLALLLLTGCLGGEVCCALPTYPPNNHGQYGLMIAEYPPLDTVAELMKSSSLVAQVEVLDESEGLDGSGFSSTLTRVRITSVLYGPDPGDSSQPAANSQPHTELPTDPSTVSHTPQKTAQNTAPSAGDIIVVSQLGTRRQPESNTVYLRDVTDPVLFLYGAPGNYSLSHPRDGLWLAHPDGSFAALSGKEALTAPTWADLVAAIDSV